MKINRLLDPVVTGANGSMGSDAASTTAAPVQTPVVETPQVEPPKDPGTQAREAREERLQREQKELWGDDKEEVKTEPVKTIPQVNPTAVTTPPLQNGGITAQDAARIAAETLRQSQPRPAAPQLTQEEIDTQLGVVKITPEMCVELGLPAEAAPFLDKLQKGIVTNAVRMSNVIVEQQMQQMNQKLSPYISFADRQQHIMLEQAFLTKNEDLKSYTPIVADVAAKLKASGFKGTQEQAFDKIAEETRKYLKGMGIDPANKTNVTTGASAPVVTTSKPNMSTVSAGSQGGAGGAPKQNTKESWRDVFEK